MISLSTLNVLFDYGDICLITGRAGQYRRARDRRCDAGNARSPSVIAHLLRADPGIEVRLTTPANALLMLGRPGKCRGAARRHSVATTLKVRSQAVIRASFFSRRWAPGSRRGPPVCALRRRARVPRRARHWYTCRAKAFAPCWRTGDRLEMSTSRSEEPWPGIFRRIPGSRSARFYGRSDGG